MAHVLPHPLIWNQPGRTSADSMPLGNGEIGVNIWSEPNGDLCLYLARTDAWDEVGRLLKVGKVRFRLSPPLCQPGQPFHQELDLARGCVLIRCGDVEVRVWVDANQPAVRIDVSAEQPAALTATIEPWRLERRELRGNERHSAYSLHSGPDSIFVTPDTILPPRDERLCWLHRNESSVWAATLIHQGLEPVMRRFTDPLIRRTFGGCMFGPELRPTNERTLQSAAPARRHQLTICLHTAQTDGIEQWRQQLEEQVRALQAVPAEAAWTAHQQWWTDFWQRSYIEIDGPEEARRLSEAYALQRFMFACAGRGRHPIKFNGSLFTADWKLPDWDYDADFRRWGECYWFQNTRLIYWPMLAAGDFDLMRPFFRLYREVLPLAIERTSLWYGHEGAFFPETISFWGTHATHNYGWDRAGKDVSFVRNPFIHYYWSGALELLALGLEYFRHTQDKSFVRETLLPLAEPILLFYEKHFPREADGRLRLHPTQPLEQWPEAVNALPDVAGLHAVLAGLLTLPDDLGAAALHDRWAELAMRLPPLPVDTKAAPPVLAPAERVIGKPQNQEDPQLYAVFPYRLCSIGKPTLQLGRDSFARRTFRISGGWRQDAVWAAALGLADEARELILANVRLRYAGARFPAFWGPNFDWIPDQDNGGIIMLALQWMLLQSVDETIYVLPAWPKDWNVRFKLHAANRTIVEAEWRDGKLSIANDVPVVCNIIQSSQKKPK